MTMLQILPTCRFFPSWSFQLPWNWLFALLQFINDKDIKETSNVINCLNPDPNFWYQSQNINQTLLMCMELEIYKVESFQERLHMDQENSFYLRVDILQMTSCLCFSWLYWISMNKLISIITSWLLSSRQTIFFLMPLPKQDEYWYISAFSYNHFLSWFLYMTLTEVFFFFNLIFTQGLP